MSEDTEEKFNRYRPKHPLPEDLQNLDRIETICKFCGVSYLIHHEIKNLEDQLTVSQRKVEELRKAGEAAQKLQEEKTLMEKQWKLSRDEVANCNTKIDCLEGERNDLRIRLDDVSAEHSCCNKQIDLLKKLLTQEREKQKCALDKRLDLQNKIKNFHQDFSKMQIWIGERCQLYKEEQNNYLNQINNVFFSFNSQVEHEEKRREEEANNLQEANQQWTNRLANFQERVKKLEEEIDNRIKEKQNLMEERNSLQVKLDEISFQWNTTQEQMKSSEKNLTVVQQSFKDQSRENEELLSQCQTAEAVNMKLNATIQDLQSQINNLTSINQEQKKTIENNRVLQFDREQQQDVMLNLQRDLERTKQENENFRLELEKSGKSYQNHIQQLKETYQSKVDEVNETLRQTINKLQESESIQTKKCQQIEQKLKENFKLEMDIEKEKALKMLEEVKRESMDNSKLQEQFGLQEASLRHEIECLERNCLALTHNVNNEKERNNQLQLTNERLQKQLNAVAGGNQEELERRRLELRNQTSLCENLQKQVVLLQENLNEKSEEVRILQDTVRRECEERYELMDALAAAREQKYNNANNSNNNATTIINNLQLTERNRTVRLDEPQSIVLSEESSRQLPPVRPRLLPALTNNGSHQQPPPSKPLTNQWTSGMASSQPSTTTATTTTTATLPMSKNSNSIVRTSSRGSISTSSATSSEPTTVSSSPSKAVNKHDVHKRRLAALMSQSMART